MMMTVNNLRIYRLVSGVRTYYDSINGTVDYSAGVISINPISISSVSSVDGSVSTQIRITATPDHLILFQKKSIYWK